MGTGPVHVWRVGRRLVGEASVRSLLRQEFLPQPRFLHHFRDHQDRCLEARSLMVAVAASPLDCRIVNGMSVDVEDYFQVSAFDQVVDRGTWDWFESRVCANTERLLALFEESGCSATIFLSGWRS